MSAFSSYYDWLAAAIAVLIVVVTIVVGKMVLFRISAIRETVERDARENREKRTHKDKYYRQRLKSSQQIALGFNLIFALAVLPFIATLEAESPWRIALDIFLILMVYDFFYYLMHRFLFHGQSYFKRVHGIHHMARSRVSSVDSLLLHPLEIFLGIALYYLVTVGFAIGYGERLHATTLAFGWVIYTQLNIINHGRIDLDRFPWKTLNWIAMKHDAHHLSMSHGNYATITLLFDWIFGTLEVHPRERLAAGEQGS